MIWLVGMVLLLRSDDLTWYELYEQAEQMYRKQNYAQAMTLFQEAIVQQPKAQKKAFTRALQVIEYKPYFYLSLCHHHLGEAAQALSFAQVALAGEVVPSDPALLRQLIPVLQSIQSAPLLTADPTPETAPDDPDGARLQELLKTISLRDTEASEDILSQLSPEARASWAPLVEAMKQEQTSLARVQQLTESGLLALDQAISEHNRPVAQQLFLALSPFLEEHQKERLRERVQAIDATADVAPPPTEDNGETEKPETLLLQQLADSQAFVQQHQKTIDLLQQEVGRLQQALRHQQISDETPEPTPPEIDSQLLSEVSWQGNRLHLQGQLFYFGSEDRLDIILNEILVHSQSVKGAEPLHAVLYESKDLKPGVYNIRITLRSQPERALLLKTMTLAPPWYTNPWGITLLTGSLFIVISGLWARKKARQAALKRRHFNPFVAGTPIRDKDMFFGRDQLLSRIENLIANNCLMLFGKRRIGKTSLLHQLKWQLGESQHPTRTFFPVYIDLQGIHEEELFTHIMSETLHELAPKLEGSAPLSIQREPLTYSPRKAISDLRMILDHLPAEAGKTPHIVWLMDEVDVLNTYSERTNQKLRSVFMKEFSDRISSIMAGIHLKKTWEGQGSPWYNFFQEIPLTALEEKEARRLIRQPIQGMFPLSSAAEELIIRVSGCQPFLIQKIGLTLVTTAHEKKWKRIDLPEVNLVLEQLQQEHRLVMEVQST